MQKACQSLEIGRNGLGADGKEWTDQEKILDKLITSWDRLFRIYDAIKLGIPMKRVHETTKIDDWFLRQIEDLIKLEKKIQAFNLDTIPEALLFEANKKDTLTDKLLIC